MKPIRKRGQVAWVWSFTLVSIGLLFVLWIWITLDEAKRIFRDSVIANTNINLTTLSMLDGGWMFIPVLFLISWGFYNWVIADQSRGIGV